MIYVDFEIIFTKEKSNINQMFNQFKQKFEVEKKGNVQKFLGMKFTQSNATVPFAQTHLIDQFIKDMGIFDKECKCPYIPMHSSHILKRNQLESNHDDSSYQYKSIKGILNYLEKSSRPDIAYAVHQCARFSQDPKQSRSEAVLYLVKYLKKTRKKGLVMILYKNESLECYIDTDFCGN